MKQACGDAADAACVAGDDAEGLLRLHGAPEQAQGPLRHSRGDALQRGPPCRPPRQPGALPEVLGPQLLMPPLRSLRMGVNLLTV